MLGGKLRNCCGFTWVCLILVSTMMRKVTSDQKGMSQFWFCKNGMLGIFSSGKTTVWLNYVTMSRGEIKALMILQPCYI